ncbi:hypothetical protein PAMP_011550 [Pampus punctatissimus]
MCRLYEDQLNESRIRVEELQRQLTEVSAEKARALTETVEYSRRLEERDVLNGQLQRSKAGLCQSIEDMKRQLEEESKVRDLQTELMVEQKKSEEYQKGVRRYERRVKELTYQIAE